MVGFEEIASDFIEASRNVIFNCLHNKAAKSFDKPSAIKKVLIRVLEPYKNIRLVKLSPKTMPIWILQKKFAYACYDHSKTSAILSVLN
jgi:hypothetical protein